MASTGRPLYGKVFLIFVRNSLVRALLFRVNFLIECVSSTSWIIMNIGFYVLIFQQTSQIGANTGWGKFEFFVFLATTMFVNSLVQAFFMPNVQESSAMIPTGNLDFALLKPIDTQFLVSLRRIEWSALANFGVGIALLVFSLWKLTTRAVEPLQLSPSVFFLYPFYILCGIAILYSLMISLASTSIWLGRNQSLYDFWFYITNFSRYPMEIYNGNIGTPLRWFFTFIIPVLIVVNVPARFIVKPLTGELWPLAAFAIVATIASLWASRVVFQSALRSYRSASS